MLHARLSLLGLEPTCLSCLVICYLMLHTRLGQLCLEQTCLVTCYLYFIHDWVNLIRIRLVL